MKVFALTVVLLFVLILLVVINAIYINNVANRMLSHLDAIPDIHHSDCIPLVREMLSYWESHSDIVGLSVGFLSVDRVTEQSKLLLSCAERGDVYGYYSALTLLSDSISDVMRLEGFDAGNLF